MTNPSTYGDCNTMTVTATFDQHRNDLNWTLYAGEDGFIRWGGYDDANWWNNVSKSEAVRTRVGKVTGRVFVLDHATGTVEIREPSL